jgi:hypothetical protein
VVVIATSVTGNISGTTRQDGLTVQGSKFAVRENFTVNGQAQFEDRGEITLVRTNTVGGTMMSSEEIAFTALDMNVTLGVTGPYGPLQIPDATTLTLSGIPNGFGSDIRATGGLTIDSCTHLALYQLSVYGTVPVVVQHSQLDVLSSWYGADGSAIQVQSCSFGPVHIQASALQVSDSLFTDDAVFVPSDNSNITGNEFKGSKVVLYTTAAISTFRNSAFRTPPPRVGRPSRRTAL